MQQPGMSDPTVMDPSLSGGMMGQSASFGTESLTNTNPVGQPGLLGGGMDPTIPGQAMPPGQPMIPGGMGGGMDPMTGMPTTDPMGGTSGGMMTSTWTQPFHNPQLYTQQRQRSNARMNAKNLLDPWGQPYRYDASMTYYGVNQYTGESRPAIWSAGPDKQDGTDDDVRNWVPEETQELLMRRRQQVQMQQQGGQYGGSQSFGTDNLMNNSNNPMGTGGMQMQNPGMPTQNPGMPMQNPGMPMQNPGMPTQNPSMPMQNPGMPQM
jgi:hypothetical protein